MSDNQKNEGGMVFAYLVIAAAIFFSGYLAINHLRSDGQVKQDKVLDDLAKDRPKKQPEDPDDTDDDLIVVPSVIAPGGVFIGGGLSVY